MLADDELREALATRLPDLEPDVEAELDRLLTRADSVARRRRTAYVVGLVAAAIVAGGLVLGHDWQRNADKPDPVDSTFGTAQPLKADRGMYTRPATLNPGRYRTRPLGPIVRYPFLEVELDIPFGWGQDDVYALATGPGDAAATRRIDLFADVRRIQVDRCSGVREIMPGPDVLDLATALASLPGSRSSGPTPVTLDGFDGYRLRLDPSSGNRTKPCVGEVVVRESPVPGVVDAHGLSGWTNLVWVLDVGGTRVVINARYGPDATPAQEAELVEMVESISFHVP